MHENTTFPCKNWEAAVEGGPLRTTTSRSLVLSLRVVLELVLRYCDS